ncbi:hypothetical protein EYF80_045722 [Liparis tanakae]|uniref:Uncharacterized protein n=1 Tax=Liparis tanakae TaxID=230148 RepID=A0A4Z2FT77_9TELE|nr:hypothetical protein EYF80_045722 [Liparis tanakae]
MNSTGLHTPISNNIGVNSEKWMDVLTKYSTKYHSTPCL